MVGWRLLHGWDISCYQCDCVIQLSLNVLLVMDCVTARCGSQVQPTKIGNLRTTTKFTTTTSVDWEKTGTRTSVSSGKMNVKMRSVGRSTTTTLNVNTDVKLWCSFATKFFAMASFKATQDLICSSRTSNFIDDEKFFVLSDLFEWKYIYFPYEIIQLSTWMRWPSPSVRQSLDFEKGTFWCDSCFP